VSEIEVTKIIDVVMQDLDYDLHKECFVYIDEHEDGSEFHKKREHLLSIAMKAISK